MTLNGQCRFCWRISVFLFGANHENLKTNWLSASKVIRGRGFGTLSLSGYSLRFSGEGRQMTVGWSKTAIFIAHGRYLFWVFICPIAIAQQGTDYKITCVCLSVSQSVCLSSLPRPQFLFDFYEILHSGSGPKSKIEFCLEWKSDDPFLFYPNFVMHFQWEGSNTTVRRPDDLWWRLVAQKTCLGDCYNRQPEKYF